MRISLTPEYLALITGLRISDNLRSVFEGLRARGDGAGLLKPHRLAHYLAQLAHESMNFRYDRELWDGKGAQARYDTRTDLGNTPQRDGDGFKFRGRTAIQITGRYNTIAFRDWVRGFIPDAPDFEGTPDLMNTDPFEGLGPIWYWETRNLNRYADAGDPEMVTKIINGGYNGLGDRLENFTEIGLRMLGYVAGDVRQFQGGAGLTVDGVAGRNTRAAIQSRLEALPALQFEGVSSTSDFVQGAIADTVPRPAVFDTEHAAVLALAKVRRALAEYDAQ
jgi:putative chitinase